MPDNNWTDNNWTNWSAVSAPRRALVDDLHRPPPLFDYFHPTRGLMRGLQRSPDQDAYRLVADDAGADAALKAGERPVIGSADWPTQKLHDLQAEQWGGKLQKFGRLADGSYSRVGLQQQLSSVQNPVLRLAGIVGPEPPVRTGGPVRMAGGPVRMAGG